MLTAREGGVGGWTKHGNKGGGVDRNMGKRWRDGGWKMNVYRNKGIGLVVLTRTVLFNNASRAHWFSYHQLLDVKHMVIVI